MAETVQALIRGNIHDVFGEHDAKKRRAKIASLWAEDGVLSSSPRHDTKDMRASNALPRELIEQFPTFKFTESGDVQSYSEVAMVPWASYGAVGAKPFLTGFDVLVMKGDKIGAVYVFHDSPNAKAVV